MIPIPSIKFIPKAYKDNPDRSGVLALTGELDRQILLWYIETLGLLDLLDPDKCPSAMLYLLGAYLNAGIRQDDDDRQKRVKIYLAIENHKRRGLWSSSVKPIIDSIAGYDSRINNLIDPDEWVETGDGDLETGPGIDWAIEAGDGTAPYGFIESGSYTDPEQKGNVYIDLHYGVHTAVLSAATIAKIVSELADDVAPAYFIIYLGFIDTGGLFVVYPGGVIS